MKNVILFKSPEGSEEYSTLFNQNDIKITYISVLDFEFINLDILYTKLKACSNYSGLVITSQRAIESIVECININDNLSLTENWKTKPVFTVGEITNKKLKNDLKLIGCGYESGNASILSEYIINYGISNQPLLFPCGNLKSETLPSKLTEAGIKVDSVVVYKTKKHDKLDTVLTEIKECLPSTLVFFSPSGFNYVYPILKNLKFNFNNSRLIAIGPSTTKSIEDNNLKVFLTAKEPTPAGILNCVCEAIQN